MGDAILASMWVFSKPAARVLTAIIATFLGVQDRFLVGLFISSVLATILAVGGVGGVKAVLVMMPKQYRELLSGPFLKVDLHTGGIAEGILTFLFNLSLLLTMFKGPSMNPTNAFGWAYVHNWHNTWEQFYVYWICHFIGEIATAAVVFRLLFSPPIMSKQKKA
ncbi:hypothetical protein FNV43_RR13353 [Rhamnella rubrinervis]|uniref:Uncharacterized protein n=1 Tax=Rhamnella rubrinervis TaxID=2594499 RepID=A0A8K0MF85_9ROSA|nr:hypothetical protein FNV43_RR13353 [Rhamnella rubrinervis]